MNKAIDAAVKALAEDTFTFCRLLIDPNKQEIAEAIDGIEFRIKKLLKETLRQSADGAISAQNPAILQASLKHFGPSQDGSVERDLAAATPPKAGDAGDMSGAELLRNIHSHKCNTYCNRCLDLIAAYGHQRWTDAREGAAKIADKFLSTSEDDFARGQHSAAFNIAMAIRAMKQGDGG